MRATAGMRAAALAVWAALAGGATVSAAAGGVGLHDPEPVARVRLEPMGFETLSQGFLVAGSSMLTVDFVDNEHLLVTFGVRRLMTREIDPPPDDDDRVVRAVLVELATGKVLARTEWRFHDRGQYLWNIGHGRFVLRVRDSLTMIAPLANVNTDDPFRQMPFLHITRHIVALMVSADDDLMTIETVKDEAEATALGAERAKADPAPVQVNFYRLTSTGDDAGALLVTSAGAIRTRDAVELPITTTGFLHALEGGRGRWLFNFNTHAGSTLELAEFETSCFPHATFVGHGEFVAMGCRGSEDRPALAGFNLKGEATWQTNFGDALTDPTFSFAPAAGRFAMGRLTMTAGPGGTAGFVAPSEVGGQEVRVFQSYNGQQLLRVDCSPVERAGENFAMSPDGMRLAVVRETAVRHAATKEYEAYTEVQTAVEVFALPPLSAADQNAVKAGEAMAPADRGARIDLALMRVAGAAGDGAGASAAAASASAEAGVASAGAGVAIAVPAAPVQAVAVTETAGAAAEQRSAPAGSGAEQGAARGSGAVWGDPQPDPERKRPTLYGPDEGSGKPE